MSDSVHADASPRRELDALIRRELAKAYRYGLAAPTAAGSGVLGYPGEAVSAAAILAALDACTADEAHTMPALEDDAAPSGADIEREALMEIPQEDRLLTPGEVSALFRVDSKTVARWAKSGKLRTAARTLGNHRRFRETDVRALLAGETPPAPKDGAS